MRNSLIAAGGIIVGLAVAALVFIPGRAPTAPSSDAITIDQAANWTYDKDGVRIGDLTISADNKNLPVTAPGISAGSSINSRR